MTELGILVEKLSMAVTGLESSFDIETSRTRVTELERLMIEGQTTAALSREYNRLEPLVRNYEDLSKSAEDARGFCDLTIVEGDDEDQASAAEEITECIDGIRDFVLGRSFKGKYDNNNTVITLQRATVGKDEVTFAMNKLAEAYVNYAKSKGLKADVLDSDPKSYTIKISGENAYGLFKGEHGKHRVIYTGDRSKTHTAYVIASVEPEIERTRRTFQRSEVRYEFLSASSKGGQHANKAETGVRLTHTPTGKTATVRTRSRAQSLRAAEKILASRIAIAEIGATRVVPEIDPGKGGYLRTYRFASGQYIKDHRTETRTTDMNAFFRGDGIDAFILAYHNLNF
ncbi:PCRF domain-containing protein [Candidatus Woesearchaeota archaeon]|jgi:peptide chain release factor 2|nr:PCRF domain-containing protein [Candidatus Woesearchaeota archaeon]MBT3538362.1 PCRF domain-containing protein [Candidatus Woesearchaeota archaeon]MBT4698339.1 PCRF domain-containing protein [Candidatus Woesearchaeota archaeon]MBT4717160.1 PCRF domain-containing protein [Candidatus Woesearchaeota archaeon]MBT7106031.1 PCRF domain-containing protein [Candidatus Woesearchaeota archaeon]